MPLAASKLHHDSFLTNEPPVAIRSYPAPRVRMQTIDGAAWLFADDVAAEVGFRDLAEVDRRTAAMSSDLCRTIVFLQGGKRPCFVTLLSRQGAQALGRTRRGKRAERFHSWLETVR